MFIYVFKLTNQLFKFYILYYFGLFLLILALLKFKIQITPLAIMYNLHDSYFFFLFVTNIELQTTNDSLLC